MIGLGFVYLVGGAVFGGFALKSFLLRRWINGGFWGLLALSFLVGDWLGDIGNGVLALALVCLACIGLRKPVPSDRPVEARETSAMIHGRRLFYLALIVPGVTLVGSLVFRWMPALVDPKQATLVALTIGLLIALGIALRFLRARPFEPLEEGLRLVDSVQWAIVLPQLLAALGALFAAAGVGQVMGGLLSHLIPGGSLFGAILVYAGGMALLTIAVGNAFAAFPVMAAAVGLPLLIQGQHGNPAAVAALGMLAGFCGTLLTPMAANFNLVPAALLELRDRYGVIRAQAPTALILWCANVVLLYWLAFPR